MLKSRKVEREKKAVKSLPKVAASGKQIAQEKKEAKVTDEDGNVITMEEMLAKSKQGERGKGGQKAR